LNSAALTLYSGSNVDLLTLTEEQKQKDFQRSANNTTAILMMEFATGTGPAQGRVFGEQHAITTEIMWSFSSRRALGELKKGIESVKAVEEQWYGPIDIATSPDRAGVGNSILAHIESLFTNQSSAFFRGGMQYSFLIEGKTIKIKVTDSYSIASGVSRDDKDNVINVPGQINPLGTTKIEFNFTYDFDGIENY
jgi:hypothetical protein